MSRTLTESTYPLRSPAWKSGIVATGTVLMADDTQGPTKDYAFTVGNSDHIGYGVYRPKASEPFGLVGGVAYDAMVLLRSTSFAVIRWALATGLDPVLRQWLMSSDHALLTVPGGHAIRRGDQISVTAVFYSDAGVLDVEFDVTRASAGNPKVCSFAYSIGKPFTPPSPVKFDVPELAHVAKPGAESSVLRALMEQPKTVPAGAVFGGDYSVVIESRQFHFPPMKMTCPDGIDRQIPQIPWWLAERDNTAPVWKYGGHEYVELPTGLLFRRDSSAQRSYWQLLATGYPPRTARNSSVTSGP